MDQCPLVPINADPNVYGIDDNANQCRSMFLNADQCRIKAWSRIDLLWNIMPWIYHWYQWPPRIVFCFDTFQKGQLSGLNIISEVFNLS